jgi:hypothetical protein
MARKPTEFVQFKLRIREALRRKIEKAAEKKDISANAEAVERIEHTFEQDEAREAAAKYVEEREAELQQIFRERAEEDVREDAVYQAALSDSLVLKTLVGGEENAGLIRLMVLGLGNNPKWAATPESRKDFADRVHHFIISVDLDQKGDEQ